MPIKPPVLDGRNQNDILHSLSELAKNYLPEWTPQENDPGMMLQRIYARLMEIALERLNKVPEKNLLAFLNISGVSLLSPTPAQVPVTFFPVKGGSAAMVPKGTQVSTKPEGQKRAVVFETLEDLTVLSTQLVTMVTVDPILERYTRHTIDFNNTEAGFMPFYGLKNINHAIYLACNRLFDFNKANVSISFWVEPCEEDIEGFLKKLCWEYKQNSQNIDIKNVVWSYNSKDALLTVDLGEITGIEEFLVQGVSGNPKLLEGMSSRLLKASVPGGLFDIQTARALKVKKVKVDVSYENMLPDAAFFNEVVLDATKEFRPFGNTPQLGDCFYIACKQALSNPGSIITIDIKVVNEEVNVTPKLKWELLTVNGWEEVNPIIQCDDRKKVSQYACFLKDAVFTIDLNGLRPKEKDEEYTDLGEGDFLDTDRKRQYAIDLETEEHNSEMYTLKNGMKYGELVKLNGITSCWLRVRIIDGNYGLPLVLEAEGGRIVQKEGTGLMTPPVIKELTISYTVEGSLDNIVSENGFFFNEHQQKATMNPFIPVCDLNPVYADVKPSLYLGLDKVFPDQPVTIYAAAYPGFHTSPIGRAVKDNKAVKESVQWEYFNGIKWNKLSVIDTTHDLTQSGFIKFLMPDDTKPLRKFDNTESFWIRVYNDVDSSSMVEAQRLQGLYLNTIEACQGSTVKDQILGSSDGNPNQRMNMKSTSLIDGPQLHIKALEIPSEDEKNEIYREEGNDAILETPNTISGEMEVWIRWHEVSNFIGSKPYSRHYVLDHSTGIVTFGNGKSGLIPPRGVNNIKATFRVGGGMAGNIERGTITLIKTTLPGIESVNNPVSADGGSELEKMETITERGPSTIRHRNYAATSSDYEYLVCQACGTCVARVKSLPNRNRTLAFEPGWVTLIIVPNSEGAKVEPESGLLKRIEDYIEKKAFVGLTEKSNTRINITGPNYVRISVDIEIIPQDISESQAVKQRVLLSLNDFLHPLKGGPSGVGWDFGRDVFMSELCRVVEGVKGVDHINLDNTSLRGGWQQQRITTKKSFVAPRDIMAGSKITTMDYKKSVLSATPLIFRTTVSSFDMKGFKEGDVITGVIDVLVNSKSENPSELDINENIIKVELVGSLDSGFSFPTGCRLSLFDCSDSTEIQKITTSKDGKGLNVRVKNPRFLNSIKPGERLTVFLPGILSVKAINDKEKYKVNTENDYIFLTVEDYGNQFVFPSSNCVMATMDNRIRLPLQSFAVDGEKVVRLVLENFKKEEKVVFQGLDIKAEVLGIKDITDIVYLEDNFLVYAGDHNINIESDKGFF